MRGREETPLETGFFDVQTLSMTGCPWGVGTRERGRRERKDHPFQVSFPCKYSMASKVRGSGTSPPERRALVLTLSHECGRGTPQAASEHCGDSCDPPSSNRNPNCSCAQLLRVSVSCSDSRVWLTRLGVRVWVGHSNIPSNG